MAIWPCGRPGFRVGLDVDVVDSLPARTGRLREVLRAVWIHYVTRKPSLEFFPGPRPTFDVEDANIKDAKLAVQAPACPNASWPYG